MSHVRRSPWRVALLLNVLLGSACSRASVGQAPPRTPAPDMRGDALPRATTQLLVVTTPGWDSISGTLRRYVRDSGQQRWRALGTPVPVVVGRSGLGWNADVAPSGAPGPRKREGDGRAPAGIFPLDTVFGTEPHIATGQTRLSYFPLTPSSECVDDPASRYYNTVVNRSAVPRVDWTSSERMATIAQYRLGVIVGYNATPVVPGRGSCIFLHLWGGPGKPTNGCTAMSEQDLVLVMLSLDRARRPMLVQLPEQEYARLRESWQLP